MALAANGIYYHGWPAGYLSLGTITNNPQPGDLIYYADGGLGMALSQFTSVTDRQFTVDGTATRQ